VIAKKCFFTQIAAKATLVFEDYMSGFHNGCGSMMKKLGRSLEQTPSLTLSAISH